MTEDLELLAVAMWAYGFSVAQRPNHGSFHVDDELGWCQQTHATEIGEYACQQQGCRRFLCRYTRTPQANGLAEVIFVLKELRGAT